MEWRIITTTEGLYSLKEDWERLEQASSRLTYFSTYEHCQTWWEVYKDCTEYALFIMVVLNNNSVDGIAPLVLHRSYPKRAKIFLHTVLEFVPAGDYRDFIINENSKAKPGTIIKEIFTVIELNRNKWDHLKLTHISQKSLLTAFILKSKYNKYFKYLIENPIINFRKYKDFNDYTSCFLPGMTKLYNNRLKKQTNFELKILKQANNELNDDKLKIINEIRKIHIKEMHALQRKNKKRPA